MSTLRLLPFAAVLLAGGCVTDYAYHQGPGGDYYSGTPRVEYRYHTPSGVYRSYSPYVDPGIYGYGWYGWYRGGAYPGPYPYPYGIYGNPYWGSAYWGSPWWGMPNYRYRHTYGNPYYGSPHRPRPVYRPPSPPNVGPPGGIYDGSPWRHLDRINRRDGVPPPTFVSPPAITPLPPPGPPNPPIQVPPPQRPPTFQVPPPQTPAVMPGGGHPSGTPVRPRQRVRTVDERSD